MHPGFPRWAKRVLVAFSTVSLVTGASLLSLVDSAWPNWREALSTPAGVAWILVALGLGLLIVVFLLSNTAAPHRAPGFALAAATGVSGSVVVLNKGPNPNVRFSTTSDREQFVDLEGKPKRLRFTKPVGKTVSEDGLPKTIRKRGRKQFTVVRFTNRGVVITDQRPRMRVEALIYYADSEGLTSS